MKTVIVVHSYHHGNTEKVAQAIAKVLGALVRTPAQARLEELEGCDLVGFGSGIDSGKHYETLLELADTLPQASIKKAFIFSTFGVPAALANPEMLQKLMAGNHSALRQKLRSKGYEILGEFGCVGLNTNSFLRLFGGVNRGRPNADDICRAEEFARGLARQAQEQR